LKKGWRESGALISDETAMVEENIVAQNEFGIARHAETSL
jgi:hypothetical protein